MTALERHSERFAASGGMGARTARRALGTPRVGFWDMFLRETLQNSSDARPTPASKIHFAVDGWHATPVQRRVLRETVFADLPPGSGLGGQIGSAELSLLLVSDSGTRGLTGPTRADVNHEGRTDFVDFVRNTGRRVSKGMAGGTYGFGKAVLPAASAAATIVIYTRTGSRGDLSRFIAMAVDEEYTDGPLRYTGRHWWGRLRGDIAEPVEGPEADHLATLLEMDTPLAGRTGTSIMVIGPRTPPGIDGPTSLGAIIKDLASAAAEYAWPHMAPDEQGQPSITFAFTCNRNPVPVPDIHTDDRLRAFAEAYRHCTSLLAGDEEPGDRWPWMLRHVQGFRPKRRLGALAWRNYGAMGPQHATNPRSEIALIRSAGFVVAYRPTKDHPSGQSTAGVFLADRDVDTEFAESEPPTHDEWVPLKGRHGDPVRVTFRRIDEETRPNIRNTGVTAGAESPGVVRVSSILGHILDGTVVGGDPRMARSTLGGWDPTPPGGRHRADPADPSADGSGYDERPQGPADAPGTPAPADGPTAAGSDPDAAGGTSGGEPAWPPAGTAADPTAAPRGRRPRINLTGEPRLLMDNGERAAEFPFTVRVPPAAGTVAVQARPDVLLDTGREAEPPAGVAPPRVLGWRDHASNEIHRTETLPLDATGGVRWSVIISQPADAAVSVSLSVAGNQ